MADNIELISKLGECFRQFNEQISFEWVGGKGNFTWMWVCEGCSKPGRAQRQNNEQMKLKMVTEQNRCKSRRARGGTKKWEMRRVADALAVEQSDVSPQSQSFRSSLNFFFSSQNSLLVSTVANNLCLPKWARRSRSFAVAREKFSNSSRLLPLHR